MDVWVSDLLMIFSGDDDIHSFSHCLFIVNYETDTNREMSQKTALSVIF